MPHSIPRSAAVDGLRYANPYTKSIIRSWHFETFEKWTTPVSQKSFPLRGRPDIILIHDKPLTSSLERQKIFDSPLANHFSAVMQSFRFVAAIFLDTRVANSYTRRAGQDILIIHTKVFCTDCTANPWVHPEGSTMD
jgi:hypothetical protein